MSEILSVSVRELCEKMMPSGNIDMRHGAFRVVESIRLHNMLQKRGGAVYAPEVSLKKLFEFDFAGIMLTGRADGVIQCEDGYIIEEIKCINVPLNQIERDFCPTHLAQAICYAYMFAEEKNLDSISVRLTYCYIVNEDTVSYDYYYATSDLASFVEDMVSDYVNLEKKKLERQKQFIKSARKLAFPYEEYRDGQRTFAEYALEAICTKKKLFAEAPTGIGKTMSALFPAIKAASGKYGKKIFYFTSKTTIANAAKDAFALLREKGLEASCIVISARDRACMSGIDTCAPTLCQNACGHYDRINEAVLDAINNDNIFDFEKIQYYATKHSVCPYELSLDLSEWCELVICDYNYLFDPIVFLKRYFTNGGDYVFLVDEAHNLGDRAREMYSHQIRSQDIEALLLNISSAEKTLYPKLLETLAYMKGASKLIEVKHGNSGDSGVFKSSKPFGILNSKLADLAETFDTYFRNKTDLPEQMVNLYFEIKKYLKISEYYDEKYVSLIEYRNGNYTFKQTCLDPSTVLKNRFAMGRSAILFSATLSPFDYYKNTLGGDDNDLTLTLESPFPKENLCLATTYKFSTRLDDRRATTSALVKILYNFINGKEGNYIAFFPSYKYMSEVYAAFTKTYPQIKTLLQKSEMSESERNDYLKSFEKDAVITSPQDGDLPEETDDVFAGLGLVRGASFFAGNNPSEKISLKDESDTSEKVNSLLAFGVLGGVFSEGIDYAGEKLIGCAIIGVGLPSINDHSNLICEYYNSISDDDYMRGYDYAYRIPGMTKVLQAAGRVIRSETDRGAILLVDDRYASREYASMFPSHWKQMKLVGDCDSLSELLRRFWKDK